ncbi:glycosyltransferase, partial [Candidatus Bathyarchaeota archaeon]|nr:glycosyltransferase [Candidatus Bathyarchaeota archaeon]
ALPDNAKETLKGTDVDILVGIPSFNNAHTINYVVYRVAEGLANYFRDMECLIFISDGGSTDGTLDVVNAMKIPFKIPIYTTVYKGVRGKGSAVKAIFEASKFLKAKAIALFDSDLRSITPRWVDLLLSPVLDGTAFVTPFYVRHKYDGTITNFLCYPLTTCIYLQEIRQPIGGDFGLSYELVEKILESPLWQTPYIQRFGIDIFETHTALANNLEVKQAFMGTKVHEPKDPCECLDFMFREVAGALFSCIDHYEKCWKRELKFKQPEIIGRERDFNLARPEPIMVDPRSLLRRYKRSVNHYVDVYRKILPNDMLQIITALSKAEAKNFVFPAEAWAKIVFLFASAFKNWGDDGREALLDALRVLWIGKVGSFVLESLELDDLEAEKLINQEMKVFVELRKVFLDLY